MGNEQSDTPAVNIEEKQVEVRDFWAHHYGSISKENENATKLSVFVGDRLVDGPLWEMESPLQRMGKNLMIYRHPCIIKYISTWQKASKCYLATEEVSPLSINLTKLSTLEICIGLHSVLKALCFLHEKAGVSHNNINLNSIYITKDCSWKLGAMQFSCKYKDLTLDYLSKAKKSGCCASGSLGNGSNFEETIKFCTKRKDALDVYGFASLAQQLLSPKNSEDNTKLSEFITYCKNILSTEDATQRPTLSSMLKHDFFNNSFLKIHSFLVELPLKNDTEKTEFFLELYDQLKAFDPELVGMQLGSLLLSRLVFLDKTAQTHLLPYVLSLKSQDEDSGLFPEAVFRRHISPKLIRIISVRDIQIRLILLKHFSNFANTFSEDELQRNILPELLLGIKDTNSELVSATLRVLADLVHILGPEIVIGGQRAKLFNDGRPVTHGNTRRQSLRLSRRTSQPENSRGSGTPITAGNPGSLIIAAVLPERPSPDGEEGETSGTEEIEVFDNDDAEHWDDWTIDNVTANSADNAETADENLALFEEQPVKSLENVFIQINKSIVRPKGSLQSSKGPNILPKPIIDITELDIKNQSDTGGNDVDFFEDMEPVIKTNTKYVIEQTSSSKKSHQNSAIRETSDKLILVAGGEDLEDGWGNEEEWS